MELEHTEPDADIVPAAHFTDDSPAGDAAWEEVSEGRFMPMRIKGSCRGRALG